MKALRVFGLLVCAACARSPEPESPAPAATTSTPEATELTIAEPDAGPAGEPTEPMAPVPPREDAGAFSFESSSIEDVSTKMRAAGAVVRKKPVKGREIVLLNVQPSAALCSVRSTNPEFILSFGCDWSAGSTCVSLTMKIRNGQMVRWSARAKVLDAPTAKGQTGRVELDQNEKTNVHGTDVPVLVCD